MRRILNTVGNTIGLVVIVGIGIILVLTLKRTNPQNEQVPTFQSPIEKAVPAPTNTPTLTQFSSPVKPNIPSRCAFKESDFTSLIQTAPPNIFSFSEPKVIFKRESPIEIIEWLPDNRHLLIHVRSVPRQSIEVVDTQTGDIQVYADDLENARNVHWLPNEQAVIYADRQTAEISGVDRYGIWLSRGVGKAQYLLDDAALTDREKAARVLPAEAVTWFGVAQYPFDLEQWRYENYDYPNILKQWDKFPFGIVENRQKTEAIAYGPPRLYLVDRKTNKACEIDFGRPRYGFSPQWSPDGRYLAILTATNEPGTLMERNDLVIVDTVKGEIFKSDWQWSHTWDLAWFPDSHYLLMLGYPSEVVDNPAQKQRLRLLDVETGNVQAVLPNYDFGGGQPGSQLALSDNGKEMVVKCPTWDTTKPLILKNRICLISISANK